MTVSLDKYPEFNAEIVAALTSILKGEFFDSVFGLCLNVEINLSYEAKQYWDSINKELFESWPEYSGERHYPVPCPKDEWVDKERPAEVKFCMTKYQYDESTEYGSSRIALAKFIIKELS